MPYNRDLLNQALAGIVRQPSAVSTTQATPTAQAPQRRPLLNKAITNTLTSDEHRPQPQGWSWWDTVKTADKAFAESTKNLIPGLNQAVITDYEAAPRPREYGLKIDPAMMMPTGGMAAMPQFKPTPVEQQPEIDPAAIADVGADLASSFGAGIGGAVATGPAAPLGMGAAGFADQLARNWEDKRIESVKRTLSQDPHATKEDADRKAIASGDADLDRGDYLDASLAGLLGLGGGVVAQKAMGTAARNAFAGASPGRELLKAVGKQAAFDVPAGAAQGISSTVNRENVGSLEELKRVASDPATRKQAILDAALGAAFTVGGQAATFRGDVAGMNRAADAGAAMRELGQPTRPEDFDSGRARISDLLPDNLATKIPAASMEAARKFTQGAGRASDAITATVAKKLFNLRNRRPETPVQPDPAQAPSTAPESVPVNREVITRPDGSVQRVLGKQGVYAHPGKTVEKDPVPVRYALVDLDDIKASNDPLNAYRGNPNYPEAIQNRYYSDDIREQNKVEEHARDLSPSKLVNEASTSDDAPPIIDQDMNTLAGNSRVMSLQLARARHPEKFGAYREALKEQAHRFGFDPANVDQLKSPALVRVADFPDDPTLAKRQLFGAAANKRANQGQPPSDVGATLATSGRIPQDLVRNLVESVEGNKMGEALSDPRFLWSFRDAVYADSPMEASTLFRENGQLNENGKAVAKSMLYYHAIGDRGVARYLATEEAGIKLKIESALLPLIESKGVTDPAWNIEPDLKQALRAMAENPKARTADEVINGATGDMVKDLEAGETAAQLSEQAKTFIRVLKSPKRTALRETLKEFEPIARNQDGLLADPDLDADSTLAQIAARVMEPAKKEGEPAAATPEPEVATPPVREAEIVPAAVKSMQDEFGDMPNSSTRVEYVDKDGNKGVWESDNLKPTPRPAREVASDIVSEMVDAKVSSTAEFDKFAESNPDFVAGSDEYKASVAEEVNRFFGAAEGESAKPREESGGLEITEEMKSAPALKVGERASYKGAKIDGMYERPRNGKPIFQTTLSTKKGDQDYHLWIETAKPEGGAYISREETDNLPWHVRRPEQGYNDAIGLPPELANGEILARGLTHDQAVNVATHILKRDMDTPPKIPNAETGGLRREVSNLKEFEAALVEAFPNTRPGEAHSAREHEKSVKAAVALVKHHARSRGMSPDSYIKKHIRHVISGGSIEELPLGSLKQIEATHGSGADLVTFDLDKVGSGEGTQFEGFGIYVNGEVHEGPKHGAKFYSRQAAGIRPEVIKRADDPEIRAKARAKAEEDMRKFRERYGDEEVQKYHPDLEKSLKLWEDYIAGDMAVEGHGRIYDVVVKEGEDPSSYTIADWNDHVPEDILSRVIDEIRADPRLSIQRKRHLLDLLDMDEIDDYSIDSPYYSKMYEWINNAYVASGVKWGDPDTTTFLGGRATSELLHRAGITGHEYPGNDKTNYVIYDPADITIKAKHLYQGDNGRIKGAVSFLEDGRAAIRAFEGADISTLVHELGHIFRRSLTAQELAIAEKWAGVKDGVWTVEAEEKFARGFERYLRDGKAPTRQLANVFARLQQWMHEIYKEFKGSAIDIDLSPEMRKLFGDILDPATSPRVRNKSATATAKEIILAMQKANRQTTNDLEFFTKQNPAFAQADDAFKADVVARVERWFDANGYKRGETPLVSRETEGSQTEILADTSESLGVDSEAVELNPAFANYTTYGLAKRYNRMLADPKTSKSYAKRLKALGEELEARGVEHGGDVISESELTRLLETPEDREFAPFEPPDGAEMPGPASAEIGNPIMRAPDELDIMPLEQPEVITLFRDLMGRVPTIKKLPATTGGYVRTEGQNMRDRMRVFINAANAGEWDKATRVLAHELFHVIDYIGGHTDTTKRGNIVRRLMADSKTIMKATGDLRYKHATTDPELNKNTIMKELWELSKIMRPIDEDAVPADHLKYRKRGEELFADFGSAIVMNPNLAERVAPMAFKGFFKYLDEKPDVKEAFERMQKIVGADPVELNRLRWQKSKEMLDRGTEKRTEVTENIRADREGPGGFKGAVSVLKRTIHDRKALVMDYLRDDLGLSNNPARLAEIQDAKERAEGWDTTEHLMVGDLEKNVHAPIKEAGFDEQDLGVMMLHQHIIEGRFRKDAETGLMKRIFNPEGHTVESSKAVLAQMKEDVGAERYEVLEQAAHDARDIVWDFGVDMAYKSGIINDDAYKRYYDKKDVYARMSVVNYIDEQIGADIKQQIGTVADVENPYGATALQGMALARWAVQNNFRRQVAKQALAGGAKPAKQLVLTSNVEGEKVVTKSLFEEPKQGEGSVLEYWEDGTKKGVIIPTHINEVMKSESFRASSAFVRFFATMNRPFRALFTRYSPVFNYWSSWARDIPETTRALKVFYGIRNRDFILETFKQLKGPMTFPQFLARMAMIRGDNLRSNAFDHVMDKENPIVRRALEEAILVPINDSLMWNDGTVSPSKDLRRKFAIKTKMIEGKQMTRAERVKANLEANVVIGRVIKMAQSLPEIGEAIHSAQKLAADKLLRDAGVTDAERRTFIRNYVGNPNTKRKGESTTFLDQFLMYFNVIEKSVARNISAAKKNPKVYAAEVFKNAMIRKSIMIAAWSGIMGEALETWIEGIPEFDRANYNCVPVFPFVSKDEHGRYVSHYIREPMDDSSRFFSGMIWKIARGAKRWANDEEVDAGEFFSDIFAFGESISPGMAPPFKLTEAGISYATGNNPFDRFRGDFAVDETVWAADDGRKTKAMLGWMYQQTGAQNITKFNGGLPSVGGWDRFYRVSGRGHDERQYELRKPLDEQKAREQLNSRDAWKEYMETRDITVFDRQKEANQISKSQYDGLKRKAQQTPLERKLHGLRKADRDALIAKEKARESAR